jgi:hypothetical protein
MTSGFSQTGGARIGLFNATWPLATLTATSDALRLTAPGRECSFAKSDIRCLSRHGGLFSADLRIEHAGPTCPEFVVFWTFRFAALKSGLERLGYDVRQSSVNAAPLSGDPAFAAAFLSFVPYIGVLFGVAAIVRGFSSQTPWGRATLGIGAAGIAFNLLLFILRL